ncbi:MAG TPA: hypothetical protein ENK31_06485, partial [Nannocystis exedens]|nr:hypothetical protein [Nannocystis exedens]
MRLRLTRFDDLHLTLEPGWYELPSHLPADERRRLIDLITAATPEARSQVEYSWREFEALKTGLTASCVVHVSLPREHEKYARGTALPPIKPRLGFFSVERPGRWPERAWDELQVKSRLASWLRRSLRSPEHPLAALDIRSLPINRLSAATCEPIELLVLVEMTVAFGSQQFAQNSSIDWNRCAGWSIGRRLANRLAEAAAPLRTNLAALITDAPDGELPPFVDRPQLRELVRLGLAHVSEGDALLVPLARLASDPAVAEILTIEGFSADLPDSSLDLFLEEPEELAAPEEPEEPENAYILPGMDGPKCEIVSRRIRLHPNADTPPEMGGPRPLPALIGPISGRKIQGGQADESENFAEFAQADQLSPPAQAGLSTRSIQPVHSGPSVPAESSPPPRPIEQIEPPEHSELSEGIKKAAPQPAAPRRARRKTPSSRASTTTRGRSHRVRAQSPRDGVIAFNPRLSIGHRDPWFVDLRP